MKYEELRNHRKDYLSAFERFESISKSLMIPSDGVPDFGPVVISEDGYEVTVKVTNTKTVCRFSYNNGHSILTYGFKVINERGDEIFHKSSRQFIDRAGNVRDSKKMKSSSYLMKTEELLNFFYPEIYKALKAAWEYQEVDEPQAEEGNEAKVK